MAADKKLADLSIEEICEVCKQVSEQMNFYEMFSSRSETAKYIQDLMSKEIDFVRERRVKCQSTEQSQKK